MAPTIGVNLRVTGHCNQGSRRHMEDMFSVAYQQTEDELDLEYAYFGIFDGHGGHEAATFAKEHLMKAIVSQPGFWSDNDKDVLRAIKDGFIATHYAMWRNLENWPKTQSGWPSTSGTTASIAFIRRSNIYIGHVGDSCIVLGYQDPCSDHWKGAALTKDHKPENPAEFERISQAGGMVVQKSGVPRVVWHRPRSPHKGPLTRSTHIDQIPFLAVARSLGMLKDLSVKNWRIYLNTVTGDLWSYNADSDCFVVSPEPDVSVHHIDLTRDRCLIFGTDGLWNMLTPDEAVGIVRKAEFNNKSTGTDGQDQIWLNPSKCLVDNALDKWTKFELRADNTSAVTLLLDPLGPPHSQVLNQQNAVSNIQSEFVPYHIESYKVNESKSPHKLHSQSSGLAICTWYPHSNLSESFKGEGATTLSAMEELFGKKVELFDCKSSEMVVNECKTEQADGESGSKLEVLIPTTSKAIAPPVDGDSEKTVSTGHPTPLKNPNRSLEPVEKSPETGPVPSNKTLQKCLKAVVGVGPGGENADEGLTKDEVVHVDPDEEVTRMKLRGTAVVKEGNNRAATEGPLSKNYQKTSFPGRNFKRTGKRGKKRKNYSAIESRFDLLDDGMDLRSKNKRRHSSLFETMNLIYEPKPKRRTRSEDQKRVYDNEEYKSDTENKLDEDTNKLRKIAKVKTKSSDCEKRSPTQDEARQNHLQERLQINSNNNNNNTKSNINNTSNNNNNSDGSNNNSINNTSGTVMNNSNNNNNSGTDSTSSIQGFTPMRLRSNMPVKTLRSRNINLEICDWFFLGLTKYNVNSSGGAAAGANGTTHGSNKRSSSSSSSSSSTMGKQQTCKPDDACTDNLTKNLTKLNALTRSSVNSPSSKIPMSESPSYRSSVHTRSQNKRLKK